MRKSGFTLIELLVVIAVIALLLTIVMPALNLAKKKAASAVCFSNLRQMSTGWFMYQDENGGRIMSCRMENVGTQTACQQGWIGQPHQETDTASSSLSMTQTAPPVTDEDEIRGLQKGKLFPYLGTPEVYHCPADKLRKGCDGTPLFVSYAMPYCLNNGTSNSIRKMGEINPPSERFVFVEIGTYGSRNWTWNGWWSLAAPSTTSEPWGLHDPLAVSHGSSAVFGFADGHSEIRKWKDTVVLEHYAKGANMKPGELYGVTYPPAGTRSEDIEWLSTGWALRPKPR
ncbi:MAG TPA: type II secretion system protein [Anaerohalosphaeraceae bacterium]|nr:type II secretion system protein [Anaerohalosphaeraceae bacterium]